MGRVLVYTTRGCPFSIGVKQVLDKYAAVCPYLEINLSDFPQRRAELEKLSGGLKTVPRVFFGTEHIGGYNEFYALELANCLERELKELASAPESPDFPTRPEIPSTLITSVSSYVEFDEEIDEIYHRLRHQTTGLKVREHGSFLFAQKKCFKGSEMVGWLMAGLNLTEMEAVEVGQKLVNYRYIHKLKEGTVVLGNFENTTELYRFQEDEDPTILNMKRIWIGESKTASEVANQLRKQILKITDNFIYNKGKAVDYSAIASSPDFNYYVTCTLEMQNVDLSTMNGTELKAFFINIYNSLVIHANIAVGPPTNAFNRNNFFNNVFYIIGGQKYSLNDIEHGILRGNRAPPNSRTVPFQKNDPRLQFSMVPFDARVHFALVCGAKSCPAIRVYSPQNVNDALQWATEGFVSEEVTVDVTAKKATLSKLFSWYHGDFGPTDADMLRWISHFLPDDRKMELLDLMTLHTVTVQYSNYDWDMNNRYNEDEGPVISDNLEDYSDRMIIPSKKFRIIEPAEHQSERRNLYIKSSSFEAINTLMTYKEFFATTKHSNYLGITDGGPVCVSIRKREYKDQRKKFEVLARDKQSDFHGILAAENTKELFDSLRGMNPNYNKKFLVKSKNPELVKELVTFEEKQMFREFKVGVLYYRDGQTDENEMFSNKHEEASADYHEFLKILGEQIVLEGWPKFTAELDTKYNYTGTHSIFTTWNNQDIMYHVATLLPWSAADPQQIEKKRHLGNDIVVIIFHDGTTPFNPECVNSEYNQVFIVVRRLKEQKEKKEGEEGPKEATVGEEVPVEVTTKNQEDQEVRWRVSIAVKEGIRMYSPQWPDTGAVFSSKKKEAFRDFLISSALSAIRCSLKSVGSSFQKKVVGFRQLTLSTLVQKYAFG